MNHRATLCGAALAALSIGLAGCGQNVSEDRPEQALAEKNLKTTQQQSQSANPHQGMMGAAGGAAAAATTVDGMLKLSAAVMAVPEGWQAQPPSSSMRVAEYTIPVSAGGAEPANLAVFEGNWGSVDANVDRWVGQFSQPGGGAPAPRRWQVETAGDMEATLVDVSGTFDGGMGMNDAGPQPGYRMLGAIVNAGSTFYYLKLTGPAQEVAPLEEPFEQMVASMRQG